MAAYLDVEGDLLDWLRFGAAARTERYSDFGSTVDGKVTMRVRANRYVIVRGSLSTGYAPVARAVVPSPQPLPTEPRAGSGAVESLTLPVSSAAAQALGAQPLEPGSRYTSAGVVIAPASALDITIDYYRIGIDDRIVLSRKLHRPADRGPARRSGANSAFLHECDRYPNRGGRDGELSAAAADGQRPAAACEL